MANSTINIANEQRLPWAVSLINKLARIGLLTDALVAGATSFQDLMDDIATALYVSGTANDKYAPVVKNEVRHLLAELKWLNGLDILTDTVVTNLLTVRGTSAVTDLRYNYSNLITDASFDAAREDYIEAAFGASSYTANLV